MSKEAKSQPGKREERRRNVLLVGLTLALLGWCASIPAFRVLVSDCLSVGAEWLSVGTEWLSVGTEYYLERSEPLWHWQIGLACSFLLLTLVLLRFGRLLTSPFARGARLAASTLLCSLAVVSLGDRMLEQWMPEELSLEALPWSVLQAPVSEDDGPFTVGFGEPVWLYRADSDTRAACASLEVLEASYPSEVMVADGIVFEGTFVTVQVALGNCSDSPMRWSASIFALSSPEGVWLTPPLGLRRVDESELVHELVLTSLEVAEVEIPFTLPDWHLPPSLYLSVLSGEDRLPLTRQLVSLTAHSE